MRTGLSLLFSLLAVFHLAFLPMRPAFAGTTVGRAMETRAEWFNSLRTPRGFLAFLRAAGETAEAEGIAAFFVSSGVSLDQPFPQVRASGNRFFVGDSKEPVLVKSLKPLLLSHKGKTWSADPGLAPHALIESLTSFFGASRTASLASFLLPEAHAGYVGALSYAIPAALFVGSLLFGAGWIGGAMAKSIWYGVGWAAAGGLGIAALGYTAIAGDKPLRLTSLDCGKKEGKGLRSMRMTFEAFNGQAISTELRLRGDTPFEYTVRAGNPGGNGSKSEGESSKTFRLEKNKAGYWGISRADLKKLIQAARKEGNSYDEAAVADSVGMTVAGFRDICSSDEKQAKVQQQLEEYKRTRGQGGAAAESEGGERDADKGTGTVTPAP